MPKRSLAQLLARPSTRTVGARRPSAKTRPPTRTRSRRLSPVCDTLTPLVGKVSAANVGPSCRRHGALVWDGQGEFLSRCSPPRLPAVSLPLLPSRCCPHRPCPHCRSRRRKGLRLPRRGARLHGHAEQEEGWLVSPPAARTGTRANRTSSCRGGLMHGGSAASKGCYPLWGGTFESMDVMRLEVVRILECLLYTCTGYLLIILFVRERRQSREYAIKAGNTNRTLHTIGGFFWPKSTKTNP